MDNPILLRAPTDFHASSSFVPPSLERICGTWYVTHSTLPMWKSKRNVTITYKPLPNVGHSSSSSEGKPNKLDDLVSYQSRLAATTKTVHGIDSPANASYGEWNWRGTGWLKMASSHWEFLGYGTHDGTEWAVTYFSSTLFTPAGIDIYSRSPKGLATATTSDIKRALKANQDPRIARLAEKLFQVGRE